MDLPGNGNGPVGAIPPASALYALARVLSNLPVAAAEQAPPYDGILARLVAADKATRTELLSTELVAIALDVPATMEAIGRLDPAAPPPKGATPPRRVIFRADELLDTEFPETRWRIPGLMSEGLALLAGRPKMGKSWWALEAAQAIGAGGRFMGQEIAKGKVIYFALEDSPKRLKKRMLVLKWPRGLNVIFCHDLGPIGGTLGGLPALMEVEKPDLVVIDTLSRAFQGLDQRSVGQVSDFMGPIQGAALQMGSTVLILDHLRKEPAGGRREGGDWTDEVMESTGKVGIADTILGLFRKRGERGATLKVVGRDIEDQDLALEFDRETCCWQVLGEANEVRQTDRQKKVLAALKALGGVATPKQIAEATQMSPNHATSTVIDLVDKGKVRRLPRVGKEQPYQLVEGTGLGIQEQSRQEEIPL